MGVSRITQLILAYAQTSGGLLISLPETAVATLMEGMQEHSVSGAARIGVVTGPGTDHLRVEV